MSRKDWKRPSIEPPEEGKKRIKLTLSYFGTSYNGWQKQKEGITVQKRVEDELRAITGENITLVGSGRTDSGVHALEQVAHFDTASTIPSDRYTIILNSRLPKTIRVSSSIEVDPLFHARFSTYAREYWYDIKRREDETAFDEKRYYFLNELPSIDLLNSYAECLLGTHDFTTFTSIGDASLSFFRDIYESEWIYTQDNYGKKVLRYRVVGNAFLYHQVRSMVGTMVLDALNKREKNVFKNRLDSLDRTLALTTAPPDGLYLARISYDEKEYEWFEEMNNGN